MKRIAPIAALVCGLVATRPGAACTVGGPTPRPEQIVAKATWVVRVKAVEYAEPPADEHIRTTGRAEAVVRFQVVEVLKGKGLTGDLELNGYLENRDDFNDRPVPYDFIRPGGRWGSCHANRYRAGAEYLLLLQKGEHGPTPDWSALSPTNEQLRGEDDEWLLWVRQRLKVKL